MVSFECFGFVARWLSTAEWQMVPTLVLATFILVVAHDFYLQRRQARRMEVKSAAPEAREEASAFPMNVVGGFKAPAHFAYHPGHTWAMKESRQLVRIGLDDFAARVVGQIDQIDLPARGRWLRQGERGWTIGRGSHRFEMLSPIEGEVVEVNPEVLRDPSLAHQDPYGVGWLVAVQCPGGGRQHEKPAARTAGAALDGGIRRRAPHAPQPGFGGSSARRRSRHWGRVKPGP